MYRFDGLAMGWFSSRRSRHGTGDRWGLQPFGSKGIITIGRGGKRPRTSSGRGRQQGKMQINRPG
jgi:hypothetical protein